MGHVEGCEAVAREIRDGRLVARAFEDAKLGECALQEVNVKPRLHVGAQWAQPMQVILERHDFDAPVPDCRTPDLATFTHQQVSCSQALFCEFFRGHRHLVNSAQINVIPQHIRGAQERHLFRAGSCCGGHGLPCTDFEQLAEGPPVPVGVRHRRASNRARLSSISRACVSRASTSAMISLMVR